MLGKIMKEKSWIIILFIIFIFSFLLDMYVLTRYNISYGRDGPFYDLQVLNILQTGFTASNDPPLAYYILTPFVIVSGNSFLGIKIGMSLIGSLMAFPAFLLTEMFSEKLNIESKIPSLLSAFLITVNTFYFQMIGDFMQNLVGVFFLLLLLYFAVKWLENPKKWKKYGILTTILLACNIFTHIYTGILAVVLLSSLLLFSLGLRAYKTGKMPDFDLKILGALGILIISGLVALFTVYPAMFSKFTTVLSFLNNSSTKSSNLAGGGFTNPIIFLTLPFLLGVFATINVLYKGLKEKIDAQSQIISKKTLLAWLYVVMTIVLIGLSVAPSVDSQYQGRFISLAFVPIALMVPLGLKFIENWLSKKHRSKKGLKLALISAIAIVFAISSCYTAAGAFSNMGPSITSDQYNSLVQIKEKYVSGKIDPNGIILVDDYHTGYWMQYVFGMQVETGNVSELQEKYPDRTIYVIILTGNGENSQSMSKGDFQYSWNPLLPYSFPFGGLDLSALSNKPTGALSDGKDQISRSNMSNAPPNGLGNLTEQNRLNTPPNNLGNGTWQNGGNVPPTDFGNITGQNNGDGSVNMNGQTLNQVISNYGTLIFSGNNLEIYKINLSS